MLSPRSFSAEQSEVPRIQSAAGPRPLAARVSLRSPEHDEQGWRQADLALRKRKAFLHGLEARGHAPEAAAVKPAGAELGERFLVLPWWNSPCARRGRSPRRRNRSASSAGRGSPWRRSRRRRSRGSSRRRPTIGRASHGIACGTTLPSMSTDVGRERQATHGAAHGDERRLQDVDAVDRGDRAEGEGDFRCPRTALRRSARARRRPRSFELAMPFGIFFGLSTTAAATTGPASGPRPASSTPATRRKPARKSFRSARKFGGFAGGAAGADRSLDSARAMSPRRPGPRAGKGRLRMSHSRVGPRPRSIRA